MPHPTPSLNRRHLLAGSASTLAAAALGGVHSQALAQAAGSAAKPLPGYASFKNAAAVVVHSSNTIETKRNAFGTSVITPSSNLYVRNNLPTP
ncbi:MAG: sulfite oxidase, partial [Comamonas sp.]